MSADLLRRAATRARELAETATPGRWDSERDAGDGDVWHVENDGQPILVARRASDSDADHIAAWDPTVTLAVAAWLEEHAAACEYLEEHGFGPATPNVRPAVVAHALLREEATK